MVVQEVVRVLNDSGEFIFTEKKLVPDVLPDASNICTLLIKLGLTFKKVC
jgi:hypothetical protein